MAALRRLAPLREPAAAESMPPIVENAAQNQDVDGDIVKNEQADAVS